MAKAMTGRSKGPTNGAIVMTDIIQGRSLMHVVLPRPRSSGRLEVGGRPPVKELSSSYFIVTNKIILLPTCHLKSHIEELFQIVSPISLHSSHGNVLENANLVSSLNSILHRRILVSAAASAVSDGVPKSSKSIKTKTNSDVRRSLSNEELRKQHGITSNIKIVLNRDDVKLSTSCEPVKITATVLDLSSVDPHNTLKRKRWWPSSIRYYSPQAELRRKEKLSKFQLCPFPSCDFISTTRGRLTFKNHVGAAHGEKPFTCSICAKRFRFTGSLDYHFKTHSDKKIACKFNNCDFKCHCTSVLTTHMKSHSGIKEFGCTVCQYRSNMKCNLKLHYDRMHGPSNTH